MRELSNNNHYHQVITELALSVTVILQLWMVSGLPQDLHTYTHTRGVAEKSVRRGKVRQRAGTSSESSHLELGTWRRKHYKLFLTARHLGPARPGS